MTARLDVGGMRNFRYVLICTVGWLVLQPLPAARGQGPTPTPTGTPIPDCRAAGYQACCNGTPYNTITQGCCDGTIFNALTRQCVNGVVEKPPVPTPVSRLPHQPQSPQLPVCSPKGYQACCNGTPYNTITQGCCDGTIFNTLTRQCINGVVEKPPVPTPVPKLPHRPQSPQFPVCSPKGNQDCCNGTPYNLLTQGCCDGTIFNTLTRQCINGVVEKPPVPTPVSRRPHQPQPPQFSVCSPKGNQDCCNGTPYNVLTQGCCDGAIFNALTRQCVNGAVQKLGAR